MAVSNSLGPGPWELFPEALVYRKRTQFSSLIQGIYLAEPVKAQGQGLGEVAVLDFGS